MDLRTPFIIRSHVPVSVHFAINVSKDPILRFEDGLLSAQCEWRSGECCGPEWSVGLEVNVLEVEREKITLFPYRLSNVCIICGFRLYPHDFFFGLFIKKQVSLKQFITKMGHCPCNAC